MTPDSASSDPPSAPRRFDRAGLVIALMLAAVVAVLVWDANQLQSNTTYGMGPQVMPIVIARLDASRQPAVGETIRLGMSLEDVHLFDATSGEAVAWSKPLASRRLAGS